MFVVSVLLLSMGALLNLGVSNKPQAPNTGMFGMQVLWVVMYVIGLTFCIRRSISPIRAAGSILPLSAIVTCAFLSTLWSQEPALSARRSTALVLTLLFGAYFASRFELKDQLRLLSVAFAISIILSFFVELLGLNPDVGIPGWYGIFYQKNSLGRNMVLSALVFLFWQRVDPEHKWLARLGFFSSALLIVLAHSATSLIVLVLLLCLLPYINWSLRRGWFWASSGIVLLVVFAVPSLFWASNHLEVVANGFGRDPLLTGRVPLWILSAAAALQRPWFGFGFDAFWLPDQTFTQRIWRVLVWHAPHAHNGFLELWLEMGLCGLAIFLCGFFYYCAKAFQYLCAHKSNPAALWPLTFLLFMFVGNLTESFLLSANSIYFILYVSVALLLSKKTKPFVANPSGAQEVT